MDSVERWLWSGTLLVWERLSGVVIMYIAGANKDIAVCDLWHRIRRDDLIRIRGLYLSLITLYRATRHVRKSHCTLLCCAYLEMWN